MSSVVRFDSQELLDEFPKTTSELMEILGAIFLSVNEI